MNRAMGRVFTIGDLYRDPRFERFSRRQLEYAIDTAKIKPVGRLGIIRAFSENQIPMILCAVRRTAKPKPLRGGVVA